MSVQGHVVPLIVEDESLCRVEGIVSVHHGPFAPQLFTIGIGYYIIICERHDGASARFQHYGFTRPLIAILCGHRQLHVSLHPIGSTVTHAHHHLLAPFSPVMYRKSEFHFFG